MTWILIIAVCALLVIVWLIANQKVKFGEYSQTDYSVDKVYNYRTVENL